jgi:DNA-binding MarR family transcriptional regulator
MEISDQDPQAQEAMQAYLQYGNFAAYYTGVNREGLNSNGLDCFLWIGAYERVLPITQDMLARSRRRAPASISEIVTALESKGLVKRSKEDKDGRKKVLSLTERGKELYEALAAQWLNRARELKSEGTFFYP